VLYTKIFIFLVMAAFSVILMMEAARQAQLAQDTDDLERDDDDDMWSHGVHFDEDGHILHDDVAVGQRGRWFGRHRPGAGPATYHRFVGCESTHVVGGGRGAAGRRRINRGMCDR